MEELIDALQNTIKYCTLQGNKDVANTVHYMEHTIHLCSCIFCHILPSRHCAVSANKAYTKTSILHNALDKPRCFSLAKAGNH